MLYGAELTFQLNRIARVTARPPRPMPPPPPVVAEPIDPAAPALLQVLPGMPLPADADETPARPGSRTGGWLRTRCAAEGIGWRHRAARLAIPAVPRVTAPRGEPMMAFILTAQRTQPCHNSSDTILDEAAQAGLISGAQASALWSFLCEHAPPRSRDTPPSRSPNVLHYLGGMLAIGAMSIFMTLGWEQFGGAGVFFIALLYFAIAWKLATRLESAAAGDPQRHHGHLCTGAGAARGVGPAAGAGAVGRGSAHRALSRVSQLHRLALDHPSSWPPWRPAR